MKRFVHDKTPVDMLKDFQDRMNSLKSEDIGSSKNIKCYSDASYEDSQFELVERKQVMDWDGFYTDYTLYYDVLNDRFVTVFGDRDIYRPEDGDYDAEFDSEWEAREWFDSYRGAEEDDDDIYGTSLIDVRNTPEGRKVIDELEEAQEEIRSRGLSYDDESEFWVRRYHEAVKKLKKDFGYHWDEQ